MNCSVCLKPSSSAPIGCPVGDKCELVSQPRLVFCAACLVDHQAKYHAVACHECKIAVSSLRPCNFNYGECPDEGCRYSFCGECFFTHGLRRCIACHEKKISVLSPSETTLPCRTCPEAPDRLRMCDECFQTHGHPEKRGIKRMLEEALSEQVTKKRRTEVVVVHIGDLYKVFHAEDLSTFPRPSNVWQLNGLVPIYEGKRGSCYESPAGYTIACVISM